MCHMTRRLVSLYSVDCFLASSGNSHRQEEVVRGVRKDTYISLQRSSEEKVVAIFRTISNLYSEGWSTMGVMVTGGRKGLVER